MNEWRTVIIYYQINFRTSSQQIFMEKIQSFIKNVDTLAL